MRTANLASGFILIVFGGAMRLWVIPLQIEEGPDGMMSPRLLPRMMVILIVGLSLLLVLSNLRKSALDEGGSPISRGEMLALGKIAAIFAIALILFATTGPLLAGAALVVGALIALGERRPLVLVVMPVALIGGTYLLFYRLLGTAIV